MFEVGQIFADATQDAHLKQEGYVRDQLLDEDEIAYLNQYIRRQWPEDLDLEAPDQGYRMLQSSYFDNTGTIRAEIDREVRAIMGRHVERILPNYRILTGGVFIKSPGACLFPVHHHLSVLNDYRKYVINIWCPLQSTTVESGTLHVLPRTHKLTPEIVSFAYESYYQSYEAELRTKYSVPMESRPGQALLFDETTHHWSTPNLTSKARIAINCNCVPKDEQTVYYHLDTDHPQQFEAYRTEDIFYMRDLHVPMGKSSDRAVGIPFLGYVPNKNRQYSKEEYFAMIDSAEEVRRKVYS